MPTVKPTYNDDIVYTKDKEQRIKKKYSNIENKYKSTFTSSIKKKIRSVSKNDYIDVLKKRKIDKKIISNIDSKLTQVVTNAGLKSICEELNLDNNLSNELLYVLETLN